MDGSLDWVEMVVWVDGLLDKSMVSCMIGYIIAWSAVNKLLDGDKKLIILSV